MLRCHGWLAASACIVLLLPGIALYGQDTSALSPAATLPDAALSAEPPADAAPTQNAATSISTPPVADTQNSVGRPESSQPQVIIATTPDIDRSEAIRQVVEALEKEGKAKRVEVDRDGKQATLEAVLSPTRDMPHEKVIQLLETLKSLGISQVSFRVNPKETVSSVLVICPADVTWREVRTIAKELEKLGDFQVNLRVAGSFDPVTPAVFSNDPASSQPDGGQSTPSRTYLQDDVQYFPTAPVGTPPIATEYEIKVFTLRNVQAASAARIIEQLFAKTDPKSIAVEERTNSIIVRAGTDILQEVATLLLRLDTVETAADREEIAASRGASGMGVNVKIPALGPEPIALDFANSHEPADGKTFSFYLGLDRDSAHDLRQRYNSLEQQAKRLSQQLRGPLTDQAAGDKLKTELRDAVRQAFEARQKAQRAELVEFVQRLQGIQQSIEMREKIRQQIIDRRVEELLDPNVKWESVTTVAPAISIPKEPGSIPDKGGAAEHTPSANALFPRIQGSWRLVAFSDTLREGHVEHSFLSGLTTIVLMKDRVIATRSDNSVMEMGVIYNDKEHTINISRQHRNGTWGHNVFLVEQSGDRLRLAYHIPAGNPAPRTFEEPQSGLLTFERIADTNAPSLRSDERDSAERATTPDYDLIASVPDASDGAARTVRIQAVIFDVNEKELAGLFPGELQRPAPSDFDRVLAKASREGAAFVHTRPQVIAQIGKPAEVVLGTEVAMPALLPQDDKNTRQQVGVSLKITPREEPGTAITLDIQISSSQVVDSGATTSPYATPAIQANTVALRVPVKEFGGSGILLGPFPGEGNRRRCVHLVVTPLEQKRTDATDQPNPVKFRRGGRSGPTVQVTFNQQKLGKVSYTLGPSGIDVDKGRIIAPYDSRTDLCLSDIPGRDGVSMCVSVVIPDLAGLTFQHTGIQLADILARHAIPLELTDEDFDQVISGNNVTKVIYIRRDLARADESPFHTVVSSRLTPNTDAIKVGEERGVPVAIVTVEGAAAKAGRISAESANRSGVPNAPILVQVLFVPNDLEHRIAEQTELSATDRSATLEFVRSSFRSPGKVTEKGPQLAPTTIERELAQRLLQRLIEMRLVRLCDSVSTVADHDFADLNLQRQIVEGDADTTKFRIRALDELSTASTGNGGNDVQWGVQLRRAAESSSGGDNTEVSFAIQWNESQSAMVPWYSQSIEEDARATSREQLAGEHFLVFTATGPDNGRGHSAATSGVNQVIARLGQTATSIANLSVTTNYVKRQVLLLPFDSPTEMKLTTKAIIDDAGRSRVDTEGQQLNIEADGRSIRIYNGRWVGVFDGSVARTLTYYEGNPSSAAIDNVLTWHGLDPREFTTHFQQMPVTEILRTRGGEFAERTEWDGRTVTVVETTPRGDGEEKRRYRFWIDTERGIVVRRAIMVRFKEGQPWQEYARIECLDHREIVAGIWLPMKVKYESLDVTPDLSPEKVSWSFEGTNFDWLVNREVPASTFELAIPEGIHVSKRQTQASSNVSKHSSKVVPASYAPSIVEVSPINANSDMPHPEQGVEE